MGDGNLLSLRWNNHISNFKFTLGQLQQRDLYSDAMIACEGRFYPVHKFVLSTCSDYFASMFERTPCKHPVIVLKDVSVRDIEFLLSYMYGGEVSVGQSDLPSLIRAAETLNIKGLAAHDEPPASPQGAKSSLVSASNEGEGSQAKRPRLDNDPLDDDKVETTIKKEIEEEYQSLSEPESEAISKSNDEPLSSLPFTSSTVDQVNTNETNFYEDGRFPEVQVKQENEEGVSVGESSNSREEAPSSFSSRQTPPNLSALESNSISWPSSFLPCSMSSSTLNNGISISSHSQRPNPLYPSRHSSEASDVRPSSSAVRCSIPPSTHLCPMCPKRFQSRADVIRHMRTHTGEKPFKCPHCEYRAALKGNLKSHILSRHSQLQGFT